MFRDLQSSLQPRLHLEIGLLRMVHAGKLQSIEEAMASGRWEPIAKRQAPPKAPPAACAVPVQVRLRQRSRAPVIGRSASRLHAALIEAKQMHLADAIEHSEVAESRR